MKLQSVIAARLLQSVAQVPNNSRSLLSLLLLLALPVCVQAQYTSTGFSLIPPLITETSPPNVMLVLSNDHELYKKAYSDFSDLDDDGLVDGAYNDDFDYGGYFDSEFCYDYDNSSASTSYFYPSYSIAGNSEADGHRCDLVASGYWSGNFLNWATMTRMDIVRHVLFGGKREIDTATTGGGDAVTVLERNFVPEDAHAFVKVIDTDTERYTPYNVPAMSFCSMTYGSYANFPLIRVAYGSWPLWATSNALQCHYTSEYNAGLGIQPANTHRPGQYHFAVRVRVCDAGVDTGSSRCKAYTDNSTGYVSYKPVGLLQRYGDGSAMNFGLLSGSYEKHIDGGVLRKNIMPLTGNATASNNEIDLDDGTFINQGASAGGIINTISRLNLTSWGYGSNRYDDCNTYGISKYTFLTSSSSTRQCQNWGNPLSEIYLEALRYFTGDEVSGATAGSGLPTAAFDTSDASVIPSLPQLSWSDPIDSGNYCASCSIILLSTGLNSFDRDGLGTVTDIWNDAGSSRLNSGTLDTLVDTVGSLEGINGGSYLIGSNGTLNDETCTAKVLTGLSDATGICPDIAGLEGGYDLAGLAYHAYTEDLRNGYDGVQNVSTYSVALAETLPSFNLDVNGKNVVVVPVCQSNSSSSRKLDQNGWTNCSFLNAKIESQDEYGGSMYIAWEDSLWGSDFDLDVVSRVEWCIGTDVGNCPEEADNANYGGGVYDYSDFDWKTTADGITDDSVQVRVSAPLASAGYAMRLGFSISGVTNEGSVNLKTNTPAAAMSTSPYVDSDSHYLARGDLGNGDQTFLLRPGGYTITRLVQNSGNRIIYHEPAVYTADENVTTGKLLENPLYYTAKYGSFNDIDDDGTPNYNNDPGDTREWDSKNTSGQDIPDGIPDNFFPITNPNQLGDNLSQIFDIIATRISSGTAAAVVANSSTGLGSVYQAYYHPQYTDSDSATITWGGVLHSMFIDDSGRFREDNGTKGQLDDTSTDYVVDIFFDETVTPNRTRFQRYTQTGSGPTAVLTPYGIKEDLETFGSIWNARDVLSDISQSDMLLQRTVNGVTNQYSEDAGTKRYIFTYVDSITSGTEGEVDSGEMIDFTAANFDPANGTNNYRYLGLANPADAINMVKYVRGQDVAGWRPRLVNIPGDGVSTPKYWVLGDIVHSSPLVVNPPSSRYDIENGDETYDGFKQQYARRRQMIYTGGNDGMLHAFNGGVWDAPNQIFQTRQYNTVSEVYDVGQSHELGAEMWGYVPMNLLPHLQWLKETNYPHVYYVDAPPQSFDVNIFADDDTHPDGWGTILVVGMRLGGGEMNLDLDGDAIADKSMSSAIIILDITNPEEPPSLVAEINTSDLGFTTSQPTLIKARKPSILGSYGTPDTNEWVLLFGSGPTNLNAATSNQKAKLFAFDLVDRELFSLHNQAQAPATPPSYPDGFFGDLNAVDWENDFVDDVVYVGTVEGTEINPEGRMVRIVLNDGDRLGLDDGTADYSVVLDMNQPVASGPNTQISISKGERWVLYGTGRLFTSIDNKTKTQQSYYGIKEPGDYDTSSLVIADLVNSTDILVQTDGVISDTTVGTQVTIDSTDIDTFDELYSFMDHEDGWVRQMYYDAGAVNPSERIFNSSLVLGSTLVFSTYTPSEDYCTVEGEGALYALNFRTGTAEGFGPFGTDDHDNNADTAPVAYAQIDLGQGAPSSPSAVVRTGDDAGVDSNNVGDMSVVSGSTTGVTSSTGFTSAPILSGRLSWEQLEIPF